MVAGLVLAPALLGCSDGQIDSAVKELFTPKRTPQQYMLIAVSDADADLRREAVVEIAVSDLRGQDWAIKGFIAIALLESDSQARCVAIRALGESRDARAVTTLLRILNHDEEPPAEVRPPDDLARWDATAALARLSADSAVPDDARAATRDTLLRLTADDSRHVRIAAARGLGYFPDLDVLKALIELLRDEDFAVAHESESALVRLTGVTREADASAWERWLEAQSSDPFAKAGTIPESRQPRYNTKMEKVAYKTGDFFRWLFPGKKPS